MARIRSGRSITTIDITGPFFEASADATFAENLRTMLEAIAAEGQADVRAQMAPHSRSGFTESGVIGRVKAMTGKEWWQTAVVSQQHTFPWKGHTTEAGDAAAAMVGNYRAGAQYRGGKLEAQFHFFRKTAGRLRRSRSVNIAELTKGLN